MPAKQPATIETVTMDDGRTVDFVGKRRLNKESHATEQEIVVRLDFRNGETRTFRLPHNLPPERLGDSAVKLLLKAAAHGLEQKLGDETAGIEDIEDAVEAVDELMVRLQKGEWLVGREGTGQGMAGASILARALAEVTGQPIAAVREYLSGLEPKLKIALRGDPTVAPVVARLEREKAERAAARGKATGAPAVDTSAYVEALRQRAAA